MKETDLYIPIKRFFESKGYEVKANGYFEGLDFWMVRFEKAGAGWVAFPISEHQATEPKRFETLHEAKINILKNAKAA